MREYSGFVRIATSRRTLHESDDRLEEKLSKAMELRWPAGGVDGAELQIELCELDAAVTCSRSPRT